MCTFCFFQNSELWNILHILRFYLSNNNVIFTCISEQRVLDLMLINHNPYQNIFQMTLKSIQCNWCYRAVNVFCIFCVFTLSNSFYLKSHFLNVFFKNQFYLLIGHTSKYLYVYKNENRQNLTYCVFTLWGRFRCQEFSNQYATCLILLSELNLETKSLFLWTIALCTFL